MLGMFWGGSSDHVVARLPKNQEREIEPFGFTLGTEEKVPSFSVDEVRGEFSFSSSLPRPNGISKGVFLFIQLKKSGLTKKIAPPQRIDLLRDESGNLVFSEEESCFWLVLDEREARVFIHSPDGEEFEVERFKVEYEETPIQTASGFPEGSAFHILGEALVGGVDLFREKYGGGVLSQRIEIGSPPKVLELSDQEWLVWKGGEWKKESQLPKEIDLPIARLGGLQGRNLLLEGWEGDVSVRLSLPFASQGLSSKIRGEELFHSIRIRSEKQISCMLEKQCLILRVGDWVLKEGGRWRVLRESQEREALKKGEMMGEIFVFNGIEMKQGQKMIQGFFFNANHSQMTPIELPAFSPRKTKEGKG